MSEPPRKQASYKRIILCADGTWLASNTGDGSVPSNVAKIARAIANNGLDEKGNLVKQVVYYHSGLGSTDLPGQKAVYGGLGIGLDTDVCQLYEFISDNYEDGDELFFFGFSRGAFTVRSAANLVCEVGVLDAVHMSQFAEMWKAYRDNVNGKSFRESTWYKDHKKEYGLGNVRVKVVGVWDTVGALGVPEWPVVSWMQNKGIGINKQYAFHNTKVSKNLDYAFHALAIDEKRITFPPTLWHKTTDGPAKELQQCWFPGVHGNIGGQAETPRSTGDYEEIGDVTFAWMVDNVSGMLTFEETAINLLLDEHQHALDRNTAISDAWGCGPIVDNFSGIQGKFFWALGRQDRTPGAYPQDPGDNKGGATNEFFHPIVRMRKGRVANWNPPPMQGYVPTANNGTQGWRWEKTGIQAVPEYVMAREKMMSVAIEEDKVVKFGVAESLSRRLCPPNILLDLDRENGVTT